MSERHVGEDRPVTERANELTQNIDVVDAEGVVRILRGCDAQLFSGYRSFVGLADSEIQRLALAISDAILELLSGPEVGLIIISGAGTSGRLAFLLSQTFNSILVSHGARKAFRYFIAGGDKALLKVQERSEDDTEAAIESLQSIEATATDGSATPVGRFLLVGVSCGLTAPCLAAQIEYAMERSEYSVALIGFNPVEMAGKAKVTRGKRSFADVAVALQHGDARRHFVCTPVVGPEAISGSTRLKSGSATKILLEIIFGFAVSRYLHQSREVSTSAHSRLERDHFGDLSGPVVFPYSEAMSSYAATWQATYAATADLAQLITRGAHSLSKGGRISYIGSTNIGLLGLIDASEQVPTFGAHPDQFRGFVARPHQPLNSQDGAQKSHMCLDDTPDGFSAVTTDFFLSSVLPSAKQEDMVIVLYGGGDDDLLLGPVVVAVRERQVEVGFQLACIEVDSSQLRRTGEGAKDSTPSNSLSQDNQVHHVRVSLPATAMAMAETSLLRGGGASNNNAYAEFAMKLMLNIFSTGAHVIVGKVYGSLMVDLRISNTKLFHRAVTIVAQITKVPRPHAEMCVLEAIYAQQLINSDKETFLKDRRACPISDHVAAAALGERIVPKALLLATSKFTLRTAEAALRTQASIRSILQSQVNM